MHSGLFAGVLHSIWPPVQSYVELVWGASGLHNPLVQFPRILYRQLWQQGLNTKQMCSQKYLVNLNLLNKSRHTPPHPDACAHKNRMHAPASRFPGRTYHSHPSAPMAPDASQTSHRRARQATPSPRKDTPTQKKTLRP